MKRQRGRGRKSNGGHQQNRNFESNGPDIKIRGSASHVFEKYQQLARDAASSGDRIAAESYLQHAEHYFRVMRSQQQFQQRDNRSEDGGAREAQGGGYQGGYSNGREDTDEFDLGAELSHPSASAPASSGGPLDVVDPESAEHQPHAQPAHPQPAHSEPREPRGEQRGDQREEGGRSRRPRRQRRRYEGGGNGNGAANGEAGGDHAVAPSPSLDGAPG